MTKTTEQKALKFIDENHLIVKGDKILVALSGGADSIFLLHFLIKYKNRLGIGLSAFHVNHQLRGKFANLDEKFCSELCSKNKIEFRSVSRDVESFARKKKVSIEEAGREIRYQELVKAAKKNKADKIATAHNASDNVETILLNLIKGTGVKGLTGIPLSRENIIRPILSLSADEIRNYLKKNKIDYRFDKSNLDSDYERNFLRNEIIPKLKRRLNPLIEEKISNTAKILNDINSFIELQVNQLAKSAVDFDGRELKIDLKQVAKFDAGFYGVFLKLILDNYFRLELTSENIHSLVNLINSQTGRAIHLKEKVIANKERNLLVINRLSGIKNKILSKKIKIGQKVKIDGKMISVKDVSKKNVKFIPDKSIEFISADSVKEIFEVRKWKTGDKFHPIGMKGTKKVSDFLSDEKISSYKKKENLVLTNSGKIVWVIGLRIDDRFKVTSKTKKILKLTYS